MGVCCCTIYGGYVTALEMGEVYIDALEMFNTLEMRRYVTALEKGEVYICSSNAYALEMWGYVAVLVMREVY